MCPGPLAKGLQSKVGADSDHGPDVQNSITEPGE